VAVAVGEGLTVDGLGDRVAVAEAVADLVTVTVTTGVGEPLAPQAASGEAARASAATALSALALECRLP
jgi:hypothetical protein